MALMYFDVEQKFGNVFFGTLETSLDVSATGPSTLEFSVGGATTLTIEIAGLTTGQVEWEWGVGENGGYYGFLPDAGINDSSTPVVELDVSRYRSVRATVLATDPSSPATVLLIPIM